LQAVFISSKGLCHKNELDVFMFWNSIVKRLWAHHFVNIRTFLVIALAAWTVVSGLALVAPTQAWAKGLNERPMQADIAGTISLAELPKQGQETYAQILKGGPFAYDKDGTVFGNRERVLPAQKRGYYREYTVKTPYARTRGAKRIVCGGSQPVQPEACYYSDDHYASFKRIVN
jgi:ribonuclease T1